MQKRRRYSKRDTENLIKLANEGKTVPEISSIMGRTPNSIKGKISQLGLKVAGNTYTFWSKEESDELMRLWDEGWSVEQISEKLGRTSDAVTSRRSLLLRDVPPVYYENARQKSEGFDETTKIGLESYQDIELKNELERRGWKVTAERTLKETL